MLINSCWLKSNAEKTILVKRIKYIPKKNSVNSFCFPTISPTLKISKWNFRDKNHNRPFNYLYLTSLLKKTNHPSKRKWMRIQIRLKKIRVCQYLWKTMLIFSLYTFFSQFNQAISSSTFPSTFAFVDVTALFANGSRNVIGKFRPNSILGIIGEIFETSECKQFSNKSIWYSTLLFTHG